MTPIPLTSFFNQAANAVAELFLVFGAGVDPPPLATCGSRWPLPLLITKNIIRGIHEKIGFLKPQPKCCFGASMLHTAAIRTKMLRGVAGTTKAVSRRRGLGLKNLNAR